MSIRGYNWNILNQSDKNLLTKLLQNRGVTDKEKADQYLNHNYDTSLFHPENISDLKKAADRIKEAVQKNEKIYIFGDYDADGVCSTAIMVQGLKEIGAQNLRFRLPNRLTEGYSINQDSVDEAIKEETQLFISCDCGTSNFNEIKQLADAGIDVIVIDHHSIPEKLPEGIFALVNPHRSDDDYVFPDLCATGLAYKMMQQLHPRPLTFTAIAAIGTIADCMPLKSENRYIVKHGLDLIHKDQNPGVQALLTICDINTKKATSEDIGFKIAPRINAAGRLGHADEALRTLLAIDLGEAMLQCAKLNDYNEMRKKMVLDGTNQAIEATKGQKNKHIIIASSRDWSAGIVGLIAGKLVETYARPAIALEQKDGHLTASCRSIPGFNIVDALKACSKHLDRFGGHAQAAGFSMKAENLPGLKEDLEKYAENHSGGEIMKKSLDIDCQIEIEDVHTSTIETQNLLMPFGQENTKPLYQINDMELVEIRQIGEFKNHLRLVVKRAGRSITCVAFFMGEFFKNFKQKDMLNIVFSLEINEFRGKQSLQFMVQDIEIQKKEEQKSEENDTV